jgi:hypothetical protein
LYYLDEAVDLLLQRLNLTRRAAVLCLQRGHLARQVVVVAAHLLQFAQEALPGLLLAAQLIRQVGQLAVARGDLLLQI